MHVCTLQGKNINNKKQGKNVTYQFFYLLCNVHLKDNLIYDNHGIHNEIGVLNPCQIKIQP